jgi:hypothetical protein
MNSNTDLDEWRELWQGGPGTGSIAAELRERALRERRRQKLRLLASSLVTVVIGGGVAARAIGSGDADDFVFAAEAWLFIAVSWAGTLWIDRGTWRPLGDSSSAFLDVAIDRCRGALKATFFIVVMYVLQLAAILWLKALYSAADPATLFRSWPVVLFGWAGVPILVAASVFYVRRKRAELDRLIALREDVVGS